MSDFNGDTYLRSTYDASGRVSGQYMAGQGTSYFTYDFVNRVNTCTDPRGAETRYHYDVNNELTLKEDDVYVFIPTI